MGNYAEESTKRLAAVKREITHECAERVHTLPSGWWASTSIQLSRGSVEFQSETVNGTFVLLCLEIRDRLFSAASRIYVRGVFLTVNRSTPSIISLIRAGVAQR